MKNCMITFRSITPAQRGELVLRRAGLECNLRRTSSWMEQQGCGYSLHLNCKDMYKAVELLRSKGIQYKKIYRSAENGGVEEMEL